MICRVARAFCCVVVALNVLRVLYSRFVAARCLRWVRCAQLLRWVVAVDFIVPCVSLPRSMMLFGARCVPFRWLALCAWLLLFCDFVCCALFVCFAVGAVPFNIIASV